MVEVAAVAGFDGSPTLIAFARADERVMHDAVASAIGIGMLCSPQVRSVSSQNRRATANQFNGLGAEVVQSDEQIARRIERRHSSTASGRSPPDHAALVQRIDLRKVKEMVT